MAARRRTVLAIGIVRPLGGDEFQDLARRVGAALGCTLVPRERRGVLFLEADLLGMRIELVMWHSRPETLVFLHGYRPGDAGSIVVDIDAAVIDMLADSGLGQWRVPTQQDMDSAAAFNVEWERHLDA